MGKGQSGQRSAAVGPQNGVSGRRARPLPAAPGGATSAWGNGNGRRVSDAVAISMTTLAGQPDKSQNTQEAKHFLEYFGGYLMADSSRLAKVFCCRRTPAGLYTRGVRLVHSSEQQSVDVVKMNPVFRALAPENAQHVGITIPLTLAQQNGLRLLSSILPTDLPTDSPTNTGDRQTDRANAKRNRKNANTNRSNWLWEQNIRQHVRAKLESDFDYLDDKARERLLTEMLKRIPDNTVAWKNSVDAGIAVGLIFEQEIFNFKVFRKAYQEGLTPSQTGGNTLYSNEYNLAGTSAVVRLVGGDVHLFHPAEVSMLKIPKTPSRASKRVGPSQPASGMNGDSTNAYEQPVSLAAIARTNGPEYAYEEPVKRGDNYDYIASTVAAMENPASALYSQPETDAADSNGDVPEAIQDLYTRINPFKKTGGKAPPLPPKLKSIRTVVETMEEVDTEEEAAATKVLDDPVPVEAHTDEPEYNFASNNPAEAAVYLKRFQDDPMYDFGNAGDPEYDQASSVEGGNLPSFTNSVYDLSSDGSAQMSSEIQELYNNVDQLIDDRYATVTSTHLYDNLPENSAQPLVHNLAAAKEEEDNGGYVEVDDREEPAGDALSSGANDQTAKDAKTAKEAARDAERARREAQRAAREANRAKEAEQHEKDAFFEKVMQHAKRIPNSPYNDRVFSDAIYLETVRNVRRALGLVHPDLIDYDITDIPSTINDPADEFGKTGKARFKEFVINKFDEVNAAKKNSGFTPVQAKTISEIVLDVSAKLRDAKDAHSEQRALRIVAEIASKEMALPDTNYLAALGVNDALYKPLYDMLIGATEAYRYYFGTQPGDVPSKQNQHTWTDDLEKCRYLHGAIITLYLKLLAESADRGGDFQIALLAPAKGTKKAAIEDAFQIVSKRKIDGEVKTTLFKLYVSRSLAGSDTYEFYRASKHQMQSVHALSRNLETATGEESYGNDPDFYHYKQDHKVYPVVSGANVDMSKATHTEILAQLNAELDNLLKVASDGNPKSLTPEKRKQLQLEFLTQRYIHYNKPAKEKELTVAFCRKHNKKPTDLTSENRDVLSAMAVDELNEEADKFIRAKSNQVLRGRGFFGRLHGSTDNALIEAVKKAVAEVALWSRLNKRVPKYLVELMSESAIQDHYNRQAERTFTERFMHKVSNNPKTTAAVVVGTAAALAAVGAGVVEGLKEKPCEGYLSGVNGAKAEGKCVEASTFPNPECVVTTNTATLSEGGTVELQVSCAKADAFQAESASVVIPNIPKDAIVTVNGQTLTPNDDGGYDVSNYLGQTIFVDTQPVAGFNGNWSPQAAVAFTSGQLSHNSVAGIASPIQITPVAGTASISLISGSFTGLSEGGNATFTARWAPAFGDDSVQKFVKNLPLGDQLCGFNQAGESVCFESTVANGGEGALDFFGQDTEITYVPKSGTAGNRKFDLYAKSVDGDGANKVVGEASADFSVVYDVAGRAGDIQSVIAPAELFTVAGQASNAFNLTASVLPGDGLEKVVELAPGAKICGTLKSNGQPVCHENTDSVDQEYDITDWNPEVTYEGEGDFTFSTRAEHDGHNGPWKHATVDVDQFAKPTVSFENPSTNATVTGIQFNEDTAGSVLLNVDYPAGTNNASVVLTFPAVQSASDFPGNYKVTGKTADGSTLQAESTIVNGKPVIDVSDFNLAQPLNITAPPNINIGNQGGEIPVNVKVTAEHADGRLAGSDENFGLDVAEVVDDFVFTSVVTNQNGIFNARQASSHTSSSRGIGGDVVVGAPKEERSKYIRSSAPPHGVNPYTLNPVTSTRSPVQPNPDGTIDFDYEDYSRFRSGFFFNQSAVIGDHNMSLTACNRDGRAERCEDINYILRIHPPL